MRRSALTLLATLGLLLAMAMSTMVVSAGWSWEDCPPASAVARDARSGTATAIVVDVDPTPNSHALEDNPGKKFPPSVE